MLQSKDQIRASFAWKANERPSKEFLNLAQSAPSLVMTNGLMQTLAFLEAKSKDAAHSALLATITAWLVRSDVCKCDATFKGVMNTLVIADGAEYLRATEEALEILRWIRQFAKARAGGSGS